MASLSTTFLPERVASRDRATDGKDDMHTPDEAVATAYEVHAAMLRGRFRRATWDDDQAEDLVQEAFARLLVAARAGTSEREASDEEEPEVASPAERREEEPQSFLAMYFRDMAELEVLRPEQEFETARNIEDLELDLWRTLLSFASGAVCLMTAMTRSISTTRLLSSWTSRSSACSTSSPSLMPPVGRRNVAGG